MFSKTINTARLAGLVEGMGRRRRLGVVACVLVACGTAATAALATPVPGATYNGRTPNGAYVVFTVSADGSEVDSYEITGVIGDTCQFSAEGTPPAFPGAPITNNAFSYGFGGQAFNFAGTFPGAQSATGTYHFHNDALGTAKACDSGVVQWDATTTATPPPNGNGGNGEGSNGGSNKSPGGRLSYATRVSFRRIALTRLGGRITSKAAGCVGSRAVTLWLGKRKIRSTRSAKNGTYRFARTSLLRGRKVHVTVAVRTVTAAVCRAASSKTVGA